MTIYKFVQNQIMPLYQGSHHLADEPRDEQQCQDAVIIASVFQEGLRHEGDQQWHLSVSLSHLHFTQLHFYSL